jgi:hypothetical protein
MSDIPKLTISCVKDLLTFEDWMLVRRETLKRLWLVSIPAPDMGRHRGEKQFNQKVLEAKDIKELKEIVSNDEHFLLFIAARVLRNTEEDPSDGTKVRARLLQQKYIDGSINALQKSHFDQLIQEWVKHIDFIPMLQLLTNVYTI